MRLTLLEMIQHILSAMGSDEVNNYNDTVESYMVAQIIQQVFYEAAVELNLPTHQSMFELNASNDNLLPALMYKPSNALRIDKIYYDNREDGATYANMVECQYLPLDQFISLQRGLSESTSNVGEMNVSNNGETHTIMFSTNAPPRFYTTSDDYTILFDSYDSSVDTTLQKAKSLAHGHVYPTFTLSNTFVPDVDAAQFPYLLAKAKTRAFNEIKQTLNQESAAEARRQKIVLQKRKFAVARENPIYGLPRYGRK